MISIFACFLPFISFGNLNLYVSEIILYTSTVMVLNTKFVLNKKLLLAFSTLIAIGFYHAINNVVLNDVIIPIRNALLFYSSFILIRHLSLTTLKKLFVISVSTLCLVYTVYIAQTVINLLMGKVSVLDFLYDYQQGRIKAFFENGTTSVVIGSLLSGVFAITLCSHKIKNRKVLLTVIFVLGILTASRSNTLSNIIALLSYHLMTRPTPTLGWCMKTFFLLIISAVGCYIILLKIVLADVNIDGSASIRLQYYSTAIGSAQTAWDLLFGHGFSEEVLFNKFGISFFESYFFNSYMQAGIVGVFIFTYLLVKIVFVHTLDLRQYITILGCLLIGNLLGGANLFSIFVLPFTLLGLRFLEAEKRELS